MSHSALGVHMWGWLTLCKVVGEMIVGGSGILREYLGITLESN